MSNLLAYAKNELDIIGLTEDSENEMDSTMRKHILHMVEEFSKEGHSGFSANYAIGVLQKLLAFEPLAPLTGDDSEWVMVYEDEQGKLWQNARCGRVFKNDEGLTYDVEGIIFYDTEIDKLTGESYKAYFTSSDSKKEVTFPYIPTSEYRQRQNETEPTETTVSSEQDCVQGCACAGETIL